MATDYMDKKVGFYAPTKLVDEFDAKCRELSINKSQWFRDQMKAFLEE